MKKIKSHSKVLPEDALTTWSSLTLSQQPWEGYPKQSKNSMWLTNHRHCTGIQSLITEASLLQTSEE